MTGAASPPDLDDLVAVAALARRPLIVQAGGGNASVKLHGGRQLAVKASGQPLAALTVDEGWVRLDAERLHGAMGDEPTYRVGLLAAVLEARPPGARPSMESGFHLLPGRLVLHLHPVSLVALSCLEDGYERLTLAAAGAAGPGGFVSVHPPGFALSEAVLRDGHGADWLLLQNHGVILIGARPAEVADRLRALQAAARTALGTVDESLLAVGSAPPALTRWAADLADATGGSSVVCRPARSAGLQGSRATIAAWRASWPLVPDDVVYGGLTPGFAAAGEDAAAFLARAGGSFPERGFVVVDGLGVVLHARTTAGADALEEVLLAHALVREVVGRAGRLKPLPDSVARAVAGMEEERYRQAVL